MRIYIRTDIYVCIYGQGLEMTAIFKRRSQLKKSFNLQIGDLSLVLVRTWNILLLTPSLFQFHLTSASQSHAVY